MSQHKYQIIVDELKAAIASGCLAPGDKIPAVSDLRCQYGVSHITALKVYRILQESALVENRTGMGYYVSRSEETGAVNRNYTLGLMLRPLWEYRSDDTYFNEIHYGIQQECALRGINIFMPHFLTPFHNSGPMLGGALARDLAESMLQVMDRVDGILIDERMPDEIIAVMRAKCVKPMVLVNRRTQLPIDSVAPELEINSCNLTALALKLGYERFILQRDYRASTVSEDAYQALLNALAAAGVTSDRVLILDDCNRIPYADSTADLLTAYHKWNKAGEKTLLCAAATSFLRFVLQNGKPEEMGLFSFYDIGAARHFSPQLAAFVANPVAMGHLAVQTLCGRLGGECSPGRLATPKAELFLGDTL